MKKKKARVIWMLQSSSALFTNKAFDTKKEANAYRANSDEHYYSPQKLIEVV